MINQEQIQGNWQQFKGAVKKRWGKLTEDDLLESEGDSEILIGKLTQRYGISKEKAIEKWKNFLHRFDQSGNEIKSFSDDIVDITENVSDQAFEVVKDCQQMVRDNPFVATGIAIGLGAVLGATIALLIARD